MAEYWKTATGKVIKFSDMDTLHLKNTINFLYRKWFDDDESLYTLENLKNSSTQDYIRVSNLTKELEKRISNASLDFIEATETILDILRDKDIKPVQEVSKSSVEFRSIMKLPSGDLIQFEFGIRNQREYDEITVTVYKPEQEYPNYESLSIPFYDWQSDDFEGVNAFLTLLEVKIRMILHPPDRKMTKR